MKKPDSVHENRYIHGTKGCIPLLIEAISGLPLLSLPSSLSVFIVAVGRRAWVCHLRRRKREYHQEEAKLSVRSSARSFAASSLVSFVLETTLPLPQILRLSLIYLLVTIRVPFCFNF